MSTSTLWIRATPLIFVLIWSTGFIVARYGMPYAPPMSFLALRYALSVFCFLLWAYFSTASWPKQKSQWLHLAMTGILLQAAYLGGVWTAVKLGMGAGMVALLVSLQPILTALWISGTGGSIQARQWLGLGFGLAGLLLVVGTKLGQGEVTGINIGFAIFALLGITIGTLYQKRFVSHKDVRSANAIQLMAALLVTLPFAYVETEPMQWLLPEHSPNLELIGALTWSVLGLTLGGSSLLYLLILRGAASSVTSLFYLVPPTTAVMAWVLFAEPITLWTVGGILLSTVGVGLIIQRPNKLST